MTKIKIINSVSTDNLGTTKKIVHDGDIKKTYLSNEKNKSNYYTIIKEIKILDKFVIVSKLEIGDVYVVYFKYDLDGEMTLQRKFNKLKKISEKKELFAKTKKGSIFVNEYEKQKNLSFKINKNGKK